jgi:hypothetical protein
MPKSKWLFKNGCRKEFFLSNKQSQSSIAATYHSVTRNMALGVKPNEFCLFSSTEPSALIL